MGIPFSTQSTLSADGETKVYRQLRHEYATLIARGVTDETIIYQTLSKRHAELEALYSTSSFSCPRVRFGRTNLQMPIITCGGMRYVSVNDIMHVRTARIHLTITTSQYAANLGPQRRCHT